jgi:hypothetical protein
MEDLRARFKFNYDFAREVALDESMILYKGRFFRLVQYMPNKPIKHGIKLFCVCSSDTAYLHDLMVYCGKGSKIGSPGSADESLTYRLVEQLTRQYRGTGLDETVPGTDGDKSVRDTIIYMDNYFTSGTCNYYHIIIVLQVVFNQENLNKSFSFLTWQWRRLSSCTTTWASAWLASFATRPHPAARAKTMTRLRSRRSPRQPRKTCTIDGGARAMRQYLCPRAARSSTQRCFLSAPR